MGIAPTANQGMTLLELLLAVLMLVVFTGVVAMVMEFTFRFLGEADSGENNELEVSNGVLIDHQEIHLAMDKLVEILAQPGITQLRLDGDEPGFPQMAFSLEVTPQVACISADPASQWGAPLPSIVLPPGYRLCLWKTSVSESSMEELIDPEEEDAQPGIYMLQALPEVLSASTLPTRRLFCRPRLFC